MARYSQIFENGIIKEELIFKGKVYNIILTEQENVIMEGNKPSFSKQMIADGIDVEDINKSLNMNDYDDIDYLGCGDKEDTRTIIRILEDNE